MKFNNLYNIIMANKNNELINIEKSYYSQYKTTPISIRIAPVHFEILKQSHMGNSIYSC